MYVLCGYPVPNTHTCMYSSKVLKSKIPTCSRSSTTRVPVVLTHATHSPLFSFLSPRSPLLSSLSSLLTPAHRNFYLKRSDHLFPQYQQNDCVRRANTMWSNAMNEIINPLYATLLCSTLTLGTGLKWKKDKKK